MTQVYDDRQCELGEGALWHPQRQQLFWFDIIGQKMLSVEKGEKRIWRFPEMVSAAGWVSRDILLMAGERDLFLFDVETEETETVVELEAINRITRPNDGRADPQGGFWIGTMGKAAEPGAGAIYRFYRGELRQLYAGISIPNAICFAPDGKHAHFADTVTGQVMKVALDAEGWPCAAPQIFLDLRAQGLNPDGAVVDAAGNLWLAQWGAGQVSAYDPTGGLVSTLRFDSPHTTCPAFGGPGMTTLFCTSALQDLDAATRSALPDAGKTFAAETGIRGQAEHRVEV